MKKKIKNSKIRKRVEAKVLVLYMNISRPFFYMKNNDYVEPIERRVGIFIS